MRSSKFKVKVQSAKFKVQSEGSKCKVQSATKRSGRVGFVCREEMKGLKLDVSIGPGDRHFFVG